MVKSGVLHVKQGSCYTEYEIGIRYEYYACIVLKPLFCVKSPDQ